MTTSPHDDVVATTPTTDDDAADVAFMSSEFVHSALVVVQAGLILGFLMGFIAVWLFFERKKQSLPSHTEITC